jgi:imidazolonepropionase-like amidohydrolase
MQTFRHDIYGDVLKIPHFRDSHMHFTKEVKPASSHEISEIANRYRRYGIFAVDDMGHKSAAGLEARRALAREIKVRSAGWAIFSKGTYGAFLGKGVSGREEIRRAIKKISEAGADFLKVVSSGIVSLQDGGAVTEGGFSLEELKLIHKEALTHNLEMRCHANSEMAIGHAIAAGASSIEHGFFISKENIDAMAEKGVAWTPTVHALQSLAPSLKERERSILTEVIDRHLSSIHYASSVGCRLRIGTDSGSRGVDHGPSFFAELALFRKAGLTLSQILFSACVADEEIERGNFLLVKKDFITTREIEAVYQRGQRIEP